MPLAPAAPVTDETVIAETIRTRIAAVRRRLFTVRLVERLALALLCGAAVALPITGARLLRERYPWLAALVVLTPLIAAVFFWLHPRRLAGATVHPQLVRIAASLAGAAVVIASLLIFLPIGVHVGAPLLAIGVILLFLIAAAATTRPPTAPAAAVFIDRQAGLHERVSTALELLTSAPRPANSLEAAFRRPVIARAAFACDHVRSAKIRYGRLDNRVYPLAIAVTLAAAGITLLTPLAAPAAPHQRPYAQVVEKTNRLQDALKQIEQKKPAAADDPDKALQPLKAALTDLRKGNMNPFQAEARLNEARSELQKEQDRFEAAERVQKALAAVKELQQLTSASDDLRRSKLSGSNDDAGQNGGKPSDSRAAIRRAAGSLAQNAGGMSQQQKSQLAGALKDAARQAGDDPQLQKSLNDAADAANKGDTKKLAQSLNDAGNRMGEQRAQQQLSGDSLRQAMAAIDQAARNGESADEQNAAHASGDNQQQTSGQQGGNQQGGQHGMAQGGQQNGGQNGQQGGQHNGQQGGSQSGQQSGQQSAQNGQSGGAGQSASAEHDLNGGSTNFYNPGGPGHEDGPLGGQTTAVKIYDEKHVATAGQQANVSGKINPLGAAAGTADVFGQADRNDPTIQSYDSQLPAARQKAMDDLQTQQIPPQYRDVIRDFYQK